MFFYSFRWGEGHMKQYFSSSFSPLFNATLILLQHLLRSQTDKKTSWNKLNRGIKVALGAGEVGHKGESPEKWGALPGTWNTVILRSPGEQAESAKAANRVARAGDTRRMGCKRGWEQKMGMCVHLGWWHLRSWAKRTEMHPLGPTAWRWLVTIAGQVLRKIRWYSQMGMMDERMGAREQTWSSGNVRKMGWHKMGVGWHAGTLGEGRGLLPDCSQVSAQEAVRGSRLGERACLEARNLSVGLGRVIWTDRGYLRETPSSRSLRGVLDFRKRDIFTVIVRSCDTSFSLLVFFYQVTEMFARAFQFNLYRKAFSPKLSIMSYTWNFNFTFFIHTSTVNSCTSVYSLHLLPAIAYYIYPLETFGFNTYLMD